MLAADLAVERDGGEGGDFGVLPESLKIEQPLKIEQCPKQSKRDSAC
jgi:hypothetical protein